MSKYIYILDAGHGIQTKKKQSPLWSDNSQLFEYEYNRNIVSYLSFMLRKAGIDYHVLVQDENDMPFKERTNKANGIKGNTLLISVHGNKYDGKEKVTGFETHIFSEKTKALAEVFQKHIGTLGKDRGVKISNFHMLRESKMPAILTENGFYSTESECKKMLTPEFQYNVAMAHFEAIKELEEIEF